MRLDRVKNTFWTLKCGIRYTSDIDFLDSGNENEIKLIRSVPILISMENHVKTLLVHWLYFIKYEIWGTICI
jgi:hypothetical protein